MSQPPTSKYPDMGEVTTLRLELGRERDRANAFEAALRTEVLKVMRVAVIQATIDADNEIARLKAEVERLKAVSTIEQRTIQGLQQTPEWSEITRLTADYRALEAENARLRSQFANSEQDNALLKAEVDLWKLRSDNWQKLCQVAKEGQPTQEYVGTYPNPVNLVPIKQQGDDKKGDAS